jgi:serine/threonine protein kinase/WD40 repeat protein
MDLSAGTVLNHYKILSRIGAGGMGEVYLAEDTRLGRQVALKVLPPQFTADSDRVRRFVGEARAASALNHPHIVTIYDIGDVHLDGAEAHSVYFIAMEFVEGTTLQALIHRDRAELKKLLEYFSQTADGLAKAHGAGIIHRDLKPENIMISGDGYAKILDFGLAKLVEPEAPSGQASSDDSLEAPTAMMGRTQAGVVMGTIGYMSPEQAQGKPVDHRSDIFSFGCMLYEAATMQKPFKGDSLIDSLHKIVYSQPAPIRDANPNAPAELQRIIRKCLAKDAGERYQSIKDVAIDLRELIREYDSQPSVSAMFAPSFAGEGQFQQQPTALHPSQPSFADSRSGFSGPHQTMSGQTSAITAIVPSRRARWLALGAGLVILAVIGFVSLYVFYGQKGARSGGPAFETTRISKLTSTGQSVRAVISPDGKYVVHIIREAGKTGLWVRQTATSSNVPIVPADDGSYVGMTFSRDGNYIYFTKGEKSTTIRNLFQIPVLGGSPKKLIEDVDSAISFSADGKRFVFVRHKQGESTLVTANADGSGEQQLTSFKQPDLFLEPSWSPDGKTIAATTRRVTGGYRAELVSVQVSDGSVKTVGSQKWIALEGAAWLPDSSGLVVSARDQTPGARLQIWELTYPDGKARKITNDLNSYAGVSLSADASSLVTVQTDTLASVYVCAPGDELHARQITQGSGRYDQVQWTPDGRVVYVSDASGTADIWLMDADGKNQKQLTSDAGINVFPNVSPDGRYILFNSNRTNTGITSFSVWRMGLDGSNPRQLTQNDNDFFPACSGDVKWVYFTPVRAETRPTLWRVPIDGGEASQLLDKISLRPVVSPDGKMIACQYSEGQPGQGPEVAILPAEGGAPLYRFNIPVTQYRWSPDSKSIVYLDEKEGIGNIWSHPITGGEQKQVTNFTSSQIFSFDWSRDGKNLLFTRGVQTSDVILIKDQRREIKD